MKPGEHVISEEMKAAISENQLFGSGPGKVYAEFALQDYPDVFNSVMRTSVRMGLESHDFVEGYIRAVATNLASVRPMPGKAQHVAAVYAALLHREMIEHFRTIWGDV